MQLCFDITSQNDTHIKVTIKFIEMNKTITHTILCLLTSCNENTAALITQSK